MEELPEYDSIVLSGGGLRAMAQLGALVKLEDSKHIDFNNVKYYSGTSMGAIFCFLLYIGYHPLQIFHLFCTIDDFLKVKGKIQSFNTVSSGWGFFDVEDVIASIILVEDLRIQKN